MSGYSFTDRVRRALQLAREEAARLHHQYVGPEHILLGLIRDGESVAARVLIGLKVDLKTIPQKIEQAVKPGGATVTGPDLPYTSRAKRILELAMMEARKLNHAYVGTEHLLLGVLREGASAAAEVLTGAGVTLEKARTETARLLSIEPPAERERLEPEDLTQRRARRAALLVRATELVDELLAKPTPDPIRVQGIATELKALLDELATLL